MAQTRSRYDELHDRFSGGGGEKAGTRYERLAAMVLKHLHQAGAVVHDMRLVGSSDVKHQIDVVVESQGGRRRLLVECKDFDVSGDKVGLDIVRSFFGAVEDISPDEAYILTCNGFTRDAEKFAAAKNIKLALLREFRDSDWEGRIKTIIVDLHIQLHPRMRQLDVSLSGEGKAQFERELEAAGHDPARVRSDAPLYLVDGADRQQFYEYLIAHGRAAPGTALPHTRWAEAPADRFQLQVTDCSPIPFQRFRGQIETPAVETREIRVGDNLTALLLFKGLGGEEAVITDEALRSVTIEGSP